MTFDIFPAGMTGHLMAAFHYHLCFVNIEHQNQTHRSTEFHTSEPSSTFDVSFAKLWSDKHFISVQPVKSRGGSLTADPHPTQQTQIGQMEN